ncbi:MAG TPA: PQQ-dependent sugar dehydrogenase [Candidatus Angelobacter sp.]|nr:PQQ-dependent sugar dehydrogenase [Candidatus Angelobacter sp.]
MKLAVERLCLLAGMVFFVHPPAFAADETTAAAWKSILRPDSQAPFGIETRVPWTASRLVGSPDPPLPYVAKRVFPKLKFKEPVDMAHTPAMDRLFVAEQSGKIFSFKNDPDVGQPDLVIDLHSGIQEFTQLYGMAFHPGFATNHFIYLCYVLKDGLPEGSHVSRFTMAQIDPPRIDPASEKIVITWLSGGHNGGCIKFGPDGYLYISTGDTASPDPPDPLNTGQDISDLLSSVLRIDVDHEDGGRPYRVPADNPFVNTARARPEVWAYGFRNPWRMSFDPHTGALWVGDVGWELWEMIDRVERGGNYGWSVVEGPQSVKPNGRLGPTPILPPVVSHPHTEAASITGGTVYHGKHLRELDGVYIYGDWVTGKFWGLRHDGKQLTWRRELANSTMQVVCFGEDNAGELYAVDYGGGIFQLEPNPVPDNSSSFPRKLSETGIVAPAKDHTPAPGVIPFSVNAELWSDGATAERFAAFPETTGVYKGKDLWGAVKWIFPSNALLAKTLSLEMEPGKAQSRRRIETQILHFDGVNWHGYAYQWNDAQTDATLVDARGADRALEITDAQAPGGHRRQTWHFHSRAECLRCHNSWGGPPLAFNFFELNGDRSYPASASNGERGMRTDNQIRTLAHIGMLDKSLFDEPAVKLTDPSDAKAGLQERARSWLHANCAHCHRFGAGGSVASFFNYDQKLEESRTVGFTPSQGTFNIPGAHVITPGDPLRSVLYYRLSSLGPAHMPRIGSRVVSDAGLNLIYDWIKQMPRAVTNETGESAAETMEEANRRLLREISTGKITSPQERTESIDRLLGSTVGALAALREINTHSFKTDLRTEVIARGTANANPVVRDLFERFVPEEKRVRRLGADVKPDQILVLKSDASRGEKVFFAEGGAQCFQCHRVRGQGRDFGPDLSRIGQKYSRTQLLDNILNPSKVIDPAFATYQVEAKADLSYSGLLVRKSADEVVLKDAALNEVHVKLTDVKSMEASKVSAMPEGLLQTLTAQEAADLLEFLGSLR